MAADVWGEVRGWRCTWLDGREKGRGLGRQCGGEALLGSCWKQRSPQGEGGRWVLMPGGGRR